MHTTVLIAGRTSEYSPALSSALRSEHPRRARNWASGEASAEFFQPRKEHLMADNKPVPPIRTLVINLMFSMFISLVVFAVASYYFLVPHMSEQDMALQTVNSK